MQKPEAKSELKVLVAEAAQSLARLDVDRLEEMALSCQALNRGLTVERRLQLQVEARAAAKEMAALARVLQATRSNLAVMNRLRELGARRTEYSDGQISE
jgi:hypothetical protein